MLTGGGNMYYQITRNLQHYTNIHLQQYKLDTKTESKSAF